PTTEANILYEPTPYESGTTLNSGLIISDDDQIFKNLLVGDTLGFFDGTSTTTTHLIIEKLSNSRIRIPSVTLTTVPGWYFFNATPIKAVAYKYTLNNNSTFLSLIDAKSNYRKCKDDNVWVNDADISNKYGQIRCNGVSTAGAVQTVS
ncbi:hypothetical protein, partial [Enterobacter cloacae complex sp. 4DZ1-17B1]|uniref:hypothetical protein n=1 Tax=Enterobacter cloacae complex sp. 4DZ1-17B1 TaxID=2511991 RepID=UPI0013EA3B12